MSTPDEYLALLTVEEELDPELAAYFETNELGWAMIRHPLVYSMMHAPAMNAWTNRQLAEKRKAVADAIQRKQWSTVVALHERPHRVHAFDALKQHLSDDEYWAALGSLWIDSENIRQNPTIWERLLGSKRRHREAIMTEDEQAALAALPDRIQVWQGHTTARDDGWSWTTTEATAVWFAKRFADLEKDHPVVSSGWVGKGDAVAYFTRRNESEILVNPRFIDDREEVAL